MWDGPCFAATPIQGRPMMKRIWVNARSVSPSSFLKTPLRAATPASSRLISSLARPSSCRSGMRPPLADRRHGGLLLESEMK